MEDSKSKTYTYKDIEHFPHQTRSRAEKTEAFFKQCVDAGKNIVFGDHKMGLRSSLKEKLSNYNLVNDIVDPKEVEAVVNPYKIEVDLTETYKNYPLINSYLNNLIGEERERLFNPMVVLTNPDIVNSKLSNMKAIMDEYLINMVIANSFDEKEAQQKIQQKAKWLTFNYRDRRERMAEQVLRYGMSVLRLNDMFNRNFEDLLYGGEVIAVAEIVGGDPSLRRGHPMNFYTIRSGDSYRIEDSDIIVEFGYIPVGKAVDEYYEYLSKKDIRELENTEDYNSKARRMFTRQLKHKEWDLSNWIESQGGIGEIVKADSALNSMFSGAYDEEGNIRRIRVVWKGKRKVGILEYLDEDGDVQKKYIDEDFPIDELETKIDVKWIWINEWYEGTLLGDDKYVKLGPVDVQMRNMANPSICYPGIVGTIFGIPGMPGKSLVSLAKPYQLMYNYFMKRLWDEMRSFKGNIAKISTALIPSGWSMDQFMYYLDQMKIVFEDPFNVGKEGAAMGKLAGNMNQSSPNIRIGDPEIIQQLLLILQFLENRIADITGISPQRKGAVQNRETYGGVERAVTQSTLNTAKYFYIHNDFKLRALEAYLETAKIAWRDQKFKRQFILDDGSQAILDFDGELFSESQFGVHITSSSSDQEMMQTLRSLAQPFMQSGGTLSMVAELYRTKDPASLQRKLEYFEEQLHQRNMEQSQEALKAEQEQYQRKLKLEYDKLAQQERANIRDNDTRLNIALMDVESKLSEEGISEAERAKLELEREKLQESIRKNKRNEALMEKQIQAQAKRSQSTSKK